MPDVYRDLYSDLYGGPVDTTGPDSLLQEDGIGHIDQEDGFKLLIEGTFVPPPPPPPPFIDSFRAFAAAGGSIRLLGDATADPATLTLSPVGGTLLSLVGDGTDDPATLRLSTSSGGIIIVPTSVNHNGTVDVSVQLQNIINGAPDGSTVQLQPNSIYLCEQELWIELKNDFTFDLNGSTIVSRDPCHYEYGSGTKVAAASDKVPVATPTSTSTFNMTVVDASVRDPNHSIVLVFDTRGAGTISQISYSGVSGNTLTGCRNLGNKNDTGILHAGARVAWPTGENKSDPGSQYNVQVDQYRAQIGVRKGSNITITSSNGKGTIDGPSRQGGLSDDAYLSRLEQQHTIHLYAVQGCTISNIIGKRIFGDFVYLGWQASTPNANVHITNCDFSFNGRVAISPMAVHDFEFDHNNMHDVRRAMFDIEPPGQIPTTWMCRRMNAHHNNYGSHRLYFLSASGGLSGADVGDVSFANEVSTDTYNLQYWDSGGKRRGPFSMVNCTTTAEEGGGGFNIECRWTDGVTVQNNTIPLQAGRGMRAVRALNCTGISVFGNNNAPSPSTAPFYQVSEAWLDQFGGAGQNPLAGYAPGVTYAHLVGGTFAMQSVTVGTKTGIQCVDLDSSGLDTVYRAGPALKVNDHHAHVDLGKIITDAVGGNDLTFGVWVRMDDTDETGYVATVHSTGNTADPTTWFITLRKAITGTYTFLAADVPLNAVPKVHDELELQVGGTTLTVRYNGVQKMQVTDASIDGTTVGGKRCGIHMMRGASTVSVSLEEFQYWT